MAEEEGVFGARVAMDAGEKHIRPVVKNGLRAVAVVVVHVQHRHSVHAGIAQVLRRQCGVVQEAIAAEKISPRMVARRAAKGEGCAIALHDSLCSAQRTVRAGPGRHPGAAGKRGTCVKRIQPHLGRKVIGLLVCAKGACGPDRGQDVLVRVSHVQRHPLLPCSCQKVQITRAVNRRKRRLVKGLRLQHRAQLAAPQLRQHMVSTGRHLKARHQRAPEHFDFALMLGVEVVVEGFDH